jgi:hypothetical protein
MELRISVPRIGANTNASAAPATAPATRPAESADHDVPDSDAETLSDHDERELRPEDRVLGIDAEGRWGL